MSAVLREVPAPTKAIHLEGSDWCELTSIGLKVKKKSALKFFGTVTTTSLTSTSKSPLPSPNKE